MARRRPNTLEDIVQTTAKMPWYVGVIAAVIAFAILHNLAIKPGTPPPTPTTSGFPNVGAGMATMVVGTITYYFQFLIPPLFLIGAAVSAWHQRHRTNLVVNVTGSKAVAALEGMTWREFEQLVGEAYRLQGYKVVEVGGNGPDGGVDLVLTRGGEKFLVQCKQWRAFKVGVDVVRQLYGVMAARGATGGFVVTSGQFTPDATAFARGRNVQLVDGPQLSALLQKAATAHVTTGSASINQFVAPPRPVAANASIEVPTCPRCENPMALRTAKAGANAGKRFWGCSTYPRCRGQRPID